MAYGSTNGVVSVESLMQQQIDAPDVRPELREQLQLVQTIVRDYNPQGLVVPVGGRAASDAFTRAAQSVFLGQASPDQAADAFLAEAAGAMRQAGRGN
jgi:ABC-type glycerol-3-phosphate transport system substrate-binding protein